MKPWHWAYADVYPMGEPGPMYTVRGEYTPPSEYDPGDRFVAPHQDDSTFMSRSIWNPELRMWMDLQGPRYIIVLVDGEWTEAEYCLRDLAHDAIDQEWGLILSTRRSFLYE
jgi:hypothetical protein